MTRRSLLFCIVLAFIFPFHVFSQQQSSVSAGGLRGFVGLINQSYHPGIAAFFEKVKAELLKQGETAAARNVDIFLSGAFGSGFLYSDRGNFYVITNNHVVAQAHTLSITFESQDGTKTKIEDLKIIATDEDADLAILALPSGQRPLVTQGLTFLTRPIEEGEDVYSAGFPGLGITPIWQFGRGMVSNASVRFPRSIDDETLMGPYIQHTAQIDAGNSGGPLLAVQRNAPSGYAVVGINTLSVIGRQAANYAIPAATIQPFINNALNPRPETFRAALDEKLEKFVEGLGEPKAVFPHIAEYLSSSCVGENAEYAIDEMFEKGGSSARRAFIQKSRENLIGAMYYAVAWTIENSLRGRGGAIRASLKEVTGGGEEYTVVFTINGNDVTSVWTREYGNWRIRSFGTVAAGDQSLIERRQVEREASEKLRTNSSFYIETGYSSLFAKAPAALYLSVGAPAFNMNLFFVDSNFFAFSLFIGAQWSFTSGTVGFMPFLRAGMGTQIDQVYNGYQNEKISSLFFGGQLGIKITTAAVPGLFFGGTFQLNFLNFNHEYVIPMKMALCITAGYAF